MTKASAGYFFLRPAIQASHCVRLRQLSWAYLDCLGPRTTPSNQLPGSLVALVLMACPLCSAACPEAPPGRRPLALIPGQRPGAPIKGAMGGGQARAEAGRRRWGGVATRNCSLPCWPRDGVLTKPKQQPAGCQQNSAHANVHHPFDREMGCSLSQNNNQRGASRTAHTRMCTTLLTERWGAH